MEGDCNFWEVFEEHLRIFGKRLGSVWEAFGKRLGKRLGRCKGVIGPLQEFCVWKISGTFGKFLGSGGEQLGGLGGGVRLLLMLMRCRCRALCMEDVWNFWEVFEGHFGSGGE